MMGGISAANSSPYTPIYDGRRRGTYAYASAAWRMSEVASPASAAAYVTVAANDKVLLPRNRTTYARGESGTVSIQVVETDAQSDGRF